MLNHNCAILVGKYSSKNLYVAQLLLVKSYFFNNESCGWHYDVYAESPYSIASTAPSKSHHTNNPWPPTRVGDFILTFPLNEVMRKASGSKFDMKVILKEQHNLYKVWDLRFFFYVQVLIISFQKLIKVSSKEVVTSRSDSMSSSEALHLSFQLKFGEKERNPLYFWGPQNPPLLSKILS